MIVAPVPKDSAHYPKAPPLDEEFAWLGDAGRRYLSRPRMRGAGSDSPVREFALRHAAALDRLALREPTERTADAARAAAEALWVIDGWDENWEDRSPREYTRWAFDRWNAAAGDPS